MTTVTDLSNCFENPIPQSFTLDGSTLTPEVLVQIGYCPQSVVSLSEEALEAVRTGRAVVDDVIAHGDVVYGINTGFGNFANVNIPADSLAILQKNLIRSHAAGVGEPLSLSSTRMLMALRLNVLAKGHSGIREESIECMLKCLNSNCLPRVPSLGTVGASGDLAPLAHIALGIIGEGLMWHPTLLKYMDSAVVMKDFNITPIQLEAKEGLALINGTQFIASIGSEAAVRADWAAKQADIIAALSVEALKGSVRPFNERIQNVRPHSGQKQVAQTLRALLHRSGNESEIALSHKNCGKVQDSYTLRCVPQIHGISHDTIQFVHNILETELNSATDNPMIFANDSLEEDDDCESVVLTESKTQESTLTNATLQPKRKMRQGIIISGGNFHGEYPAKAMDYLAIATHELGNVSERRIERLVNPHLSNLPAFLVENGGLNSGFMIAHCTAAALVSENKTLCHPASVDSISTSAAQEDHVSMGGFAARKALTVARHVETVLAIELLCACQAIDFLRPLHTTPALEAVHALVRNAIPKLESDRIMNDDIDKAAALIRSRKLWKAVEPFFPTSC